jgi:hypothetical protein
MCCGQFKDELYKQCLVDASLIRLSNFVNHAIDVEHKPVDTVIAEMHRELEKEEFRIKLAQQLVIAHAKYDNPSICLLNTEESKDSDYKSLLVSLERRRSRGSTKQSDTPYVFDAMAIQAKIDDYVR